MRIFGKDINYVWAGVIATVMLLMFLFIYSCKKLEIERIIILRTGEASNITANSASIPGIVLDIGEAGITQYGHCWSREENPVAELVTKTNLGSRNDVGDFYSDIGGLEGATIYHVRAYAVSEGRTIYGNNISFTTDEILIPTVTTAEPSDVTANSAKCGGNVTSDGGNEVSLRGVCWSTGPDPEVSGPHTTDGSGGGSFVSIISGLSPQTEYHVRAYATNNAGTAYGENKIFMTEPVNLQVSDIDGNVYSSVQIGDQLWFKENLRTTTYNDGMPIQLVTEVDPWSNLSSDAYCWLNNDEMTYAQIYGAYYTWWAVETGKLCPSGWHVPSEDDWQQLEIFLGMNPDVLNDIGTRGTNEGGKLKAIGTTYWDEPNQEATNETGFSALPAGDRTDLGNFAGERMKAEFWSSTQGISPNEAWHRKLYTDQGGINRDERDKGNGFSVRCIKD